VDILLDLGLIIAAGVVIMWLLRTVVARALGYIVAGIIIGTVLRPIVQPTLLTGFDALSGAALGFITFFIGQEFTRKNLRRIGSRGPVLATAQAVLTFGVVFGGILLCGALQLFNLEHLVPEALLIASTATATAPSGVFEAIRRMRSRGPVTETLKMAVTFDDAVAIVLFDICVVIARAMMGDQSGGLVGVLTASVRELGLSFLLGIGSGIVTSTAARLLKSRNEVRVMTIGMVLLTIGLCRVWQLSPLLASMVLGTVFANMVSDAERVFEDLDHWSDPLLLLFFFLAGATTEFSLLRTAWPLVLVYILLRAGGKVVGSGLGACLIRAPASVGRHLGWAMLPEAGLAIGHALVITSLFPSLKYITMTTVVAVLVFDLVGLRMAQYSLRASGEQNAMASGDEENPKSEYD
jgi:Kef-type K+ transport system membrane component KefB